MLGLGDAASLAGIAVGATTVVGVFVAGVWRLAIHVTTTADNLRAEIKDAVAEEAGDRDSQVKTMRDELNIRASLAESRVHEASRRMEVLTTSIEEVATNVARLSESTLTRADFQATMDAQRRELLEHIDRRNQPSRRRHTDYPEE
mgnify:CR=1 FL=1